MGKYTNLGAGFDRNFRNSLNGNFDNIDVDIKAQKTRVDNLIVGTPQPSEVVDARGGFPVLKDRLDGFTTQLSDNVQSIKFHFNAKGDGLTNDTQAFLDAFNSIGTSGKKLRIPNGTYLVDPDVLVMPVGLWIEGESYTGTIIKSTNPSKIGFGIKTSTSCQISNVYIRGFGVGISNNSYFCKIYDNKLSYNEVGITFNTNSYIVKCINNEITFNTVGVLIGNQTYELIVKNNVIDNNQLGVGIHSNSNGYILSGNTIEGNRNTTTTNGCGVLIVGLNMSRSVISDNWFESNGDSTKSADIIISPYHATTFDPYALDIYNTVINDCVPVAYQSLFTNKVCSIGTITIKENAHNFTKHGVIIGSDGKLNIKISDSYFKGVLGKLNIPIYLGFKRDVSTVVDISNCNANNSDNIAIDAEMIKGVKGTIVYSWGIIPTTTNDIKFNNSPLFILTTTFANLLTKCSMKQVEPIFAGGTAGTTTEKSILDKYYKGKSIEGTGTTIEAREIGQTAPVLDSTKPAYYFITIGDKRSAPRVTRTGGTTAYTINSHNLFKVIQNSDLTTGRMYISNGDVIYLVLLITDVQYAQYFNMVDSVNISDIHTQYILSEKTGTITYSGDGATTIKVIPHGLTGTPTFFQVTPSSVDAGTAGIKFVTADATNLTVTFNTAPISGTNNLKLTWKAEL